MNLNIKTIKPEQKTTYSVRLEKSLINWYKRQAELNNVSANALMRAVLKKFRNEN